MPWGISHKYKFIYIHIPKTAGTTICSSWEGALLKQICKETGVLGGGHKSALQIKESYPEEFEKYLKWTVVRNPYDRFVSKYFYKQLKPRENFDLEWTDQESEGLLPQLYWITDREQFQKADGYDQFYFHPDTHYGRIIVDRVLRFENLETELKALFDELGIPASTKVFPHFRETKKPGMYQPFFDDHLRGLVKFLYREDLRRLNYEWEENGK